MTDYYAKLKGLFQYDGFAVDALNIHEKFQGRKIIVYGAGESFHYFKEVMMRQLGFRPDIILDRKFSQGDTFEGIPATNLMAYQPCEEEIKNSIIVICLGKQPYLQDIQQELKDKGFGEIIHLMDIYEIHNPFNLPTELDTLGFEYFSKHKVAIETALSLFEDDLSREIFIRFLRTHMLRIPVAIPMSQRHEQYTPKDVPLSRGYSRMIYCGVSVGELRSVLQRIGKIEEIVCFEPDPNSFREAKQFLGHQGYQYADRITILPCAVHRDEYITPFFYANTSFGSRILESGTAYAQCVAIDDILPGYEATFINMDIEGAELEALKGAQHLLQTSRPDLAICVYHSVNHIWQIPLFIHDLGLTYRFYLRNYTSFSSETVLYATT